jgi:integrase
MANIKVALLRYANVPERGWRRGAAVIGKTGKVKPDYMSFGKGKNKVEIYAPNGRYELRQYMGGKAVYINVGTEPQEALVARDKAAEEVRQRNNGYIPINGTSTTANFKPETLDDFRKKYIAKFTDESAGDDARRHHTVSINGFCSTLPSGTIPSEITQQHVVNYCAILDRTLHSRTRSNRYRTVRSFLGMCRIDVKQLISLKVHRKLKRYKKRPIEFYTDAELLKLFRVCAPYWRLMFMCFRYLGFREQELMYLRWEDIQPIRNGSDRFHAMVDERTFTSSNGVKYHFSPKTQADCEDDDAVSSVRNIIIPVELYRALMAWKKERPGTVLVFGTANDAPQFHMLEFLKKCVYRAGLNCGKCSSCMSGKKHKATGAVHCSRWYLHGFRASFCTALYRACKDIKVCQKAMGHSPNDLTATLRYIKDSEDTAVHEALDRVSVVPQPQSHSTASAAK